MKFTIKYEQGEMTMKSSKNLCKKLLSVMLAVSITGTLFTGVFSVSAEESVLQKEVYFNDFDDSGTFDSDFDVLNTSDSVSVSDKNFSLETDGTSSVAAVNANDGDPQNGNWPKRLLVLKDKTYKNFEVEVVYKRSDNVSAYGQIWLQLRKTTADANDDTAGSGFNVMVDREGKLNVKINGQNKMWDYVNSEISYIDNAYHTLKVSVEDNIFKIYLDGTLFYEYDDTEGLTSSGMVAIYGNKVTNGAIDSLKVTPIVPTVSLINELSGTEVVYGTVFEDITLPDTVTVIDSKGSLHTFDVSWSDESYDAQTAGKYTLTGTLDIPEELYLLNSDNKTAVISVTVAEEEAQPEEVASVASVDKIMVIKGTNDTGLPEKLAVTDKNGGTHDLAVTWSSEDFNASTVGNYTFTGVLTMPHAMLVNPDNVKATATVEVVLGYDPNNTIKVDFESTDDLSKFSAYYIDTMTTQNMTGTSRDASANWKVENGVLTRINDFAGNDGGTNKIAMLTYKARSYKNFTVSIDYQAGSDSLYWPVLALRQQDGKNYFLSDGFGAFVQQEGNATIWSSGSDGPVQSSAKTGYVKEKLHNLKVKVVGTQAEVYLDDVLSLTTTLPSTVAEDGYISIVTVNNGATLDNFMITELDASGNPVTKLTTSSVTDTPSTGDNNNTLFMLWASLAVLSAAGLVVSRKDFTQITEKISYDN